MNKKLVGVLAAAVVLGGVFSFQTFAKENPQNVGGVETQNHIGIEKAKSAALAEVNGTIESVELERDNGKFYYEVDIDQGNKDFDVHVDANSASILKVEDDDDNDDDWDEKATKTETKSIMSEAEASAIAKKNVHGEVVEIELDEDDNRYEYEIKLKTKDGKADITIDASTGKVLEFDQDHNDDDDRYDD